MLADPPHRARAAAADQGVYLELNPYSQTGLSTLQTAAATACNLQTPPAQNAFCATTIPGSNNDVGVGSPILNQNVSACGTTYDGCAPAAAPLPACNLNNSPPATYGVLYQALITFAQALENSLGTITGATEGTMVAASQTYANISATFLLSIPTRNAEAFPDVDCGLNNSRVGACTVDNPYLTGDQWSPLYLVEAIEALGTTAGAGAAARAAYANFATSFSYAGLALNATNLMNPPTTITPPGPPPGTPPFTTPNTTMVGTGCGPTNVSSQTISDSELPCNLNYNPARDGANQGTLQTANNVTAPGVGSDTFYAITGLGTLIGWQTAPNSAQNNNCAFPSGGSASEYDQTMQFGLNNGAQYIEVSVGELTGATQASCQPSVATALAHLLAGNRTTCDYMTQ